MTKKRILLLGDSIIDNGVYVNPGEPDVVEQVRSLLPDYEIVLRAVDGSVTSDVIKSQVQKLRDDDIIVLSTGGNDALGHISLLSDITEASLLKLLLQMRQIRERFRSEYRDLLSKLANGQRKILTFTIYNPNFLEEGRPIEEQHAAEAALSFFNDVIHQETSRLNIDCMDIRNLFTSLKDYANPIEPSMIGGAKLAEAVKRWVGKLER